MAARLRPRQRPGGLRRLCSGAAAGSWGDFVPGGGHRPSRRNCRTTGRWHDLAYGPGTSRAEAAEVVPARLLQRRSGSWGARSDRASGRGLCRRREAAKGAEASRRRGRLAAAAETRKRPWLALPGVGRSGRQVGELPFRLVLWRSGRCGCALLRGAVRGRARLGARSSGNCAVSGGPAARSGGGRGRRTVPRSRRPRPRLQPDVPGDGRRDASPGRAILVRAHARDAAARSRRRRVLRPGGQRRRDEILGGRSGDPDGRRRRRPGASGGDDLDRAGLGPDAAPLDSRIIDEPEPSTRQAKTRFCPVRLLRASHAAAALRRVPGVVRRARGGRGPRPTRRVWSRPSPRTARVFGAVSPRSSSSP